MRLKLTWNKTNDSILFDAHHEKFTTWFVETSQEKGNRYKSGGQLVDEFFFPRNTQQFIQEEIEYIDTVNEILGKLKLPLFQKPENWYDQRQLNTLHKAWADTRAKIPKLSDLLFKIDNKYFQAYQEMNCHIHLIEQSFNYAFRDSTNWRVDNPFKRDLFTWQVSNLYVEYPGHGRFAFEKFQNLDIYQDIWEDDCNWDNIDAFVGINLRRPYQATPPAEFLEWSQQKNLVPLPGSLSLGNLCDWEKNLTLARQTLEENVIINDNYFSLSIL